MPAQGSESDKAMENAVDKLMSGQAQNGETHKQRSRLDADHFRGLREEMMAELEGKKAAIIHPATVGANFVTLAIFLNSLQMGAAVQLRGEPKQLWFVCDQVFTFIFAVEMVAKLYTMRGSYFRSNWNCMDFMLANFSMLSNWILPAFNLYPPLDVFQVIRLIRLCRLVRLMRINKSLEVLVEGMFKSMQSLGWIVVLLAVICYSFGILCVSTIAPDKYKGDPDFDPELYFGDLEKAMLTLFNICILAEWPEVIRPIWAKQPAVVVFVFLPYLMLCTFGVLNLIIGVIAEQTMANSEADKQAEATRKLRRKMKLIMRMTDEIFEGQQEELTTEDFHNAVVRHPDIVDTLRACEFPRGFEVKHLHMIFDESMGGTVDKDEFVNGIFRLIFNDLNQHATTLLLSMAQMRVYNRDMELRLQELCGGAAAGAGGDAQRGHLLPSDEPQQLAQSHELQQVLGAALEEWRQESRALLQRLERAESAAGRLSPRDSQDGLPLQEKENKMGDLSSRLDEMRRDLLGAQEGLRRELAASAKQAPQHARLDLDMEAVKALAAALTPLLSADLSAGGHSMEPLSHRSHERLLLGPSAAASAAAAGPVRDPPPYHSRTPGGVALCFGGAQAQTPSGRSDPGSGNCVARTFKKQRA